MRRWLVIVLMLLGSRAYAQTNALSSLQRLQIDALNVIASGVGTSSGTTVIISTTLTAIELKTSQIQFSNNRVKVETHGEFTSVLASILVVGGTGFTAFNSTGTLAHCSVAVPNPAAAYDFEIVTNDADEFPIFGKSALTGRASLAGERHLQGAYKFKVAAATIDGTYTALCDTKL